MKGRKPKPTLMRDLEGNPGKRPINDREPRAPAGIPDCPEFLDDEAKAEWFRMVTVLKEMGLLSLADRSALAAYCTAYCRWVHAEEQVRKFGDDREEPGKGISDEESRICPSPIRPWRPCGSSWWSSD